MHGLVSLALERGYKFGWAANKQKFRTNGNLKGLFKEERQIRSEIIKARGEGIRAAVEGGA